MFTQFFGNYLLNKGLVPADKLSEALSAQSRTRPKLGVLAINAGYMTARQVALVHARQQQTDKRMGDLAVEMGFMTDEQVSELLSVQGEGHLKLGQALIDSGVMTNESFAEALNAYKEENSLTDVDFSEDSGEKIDGIISRFYSFPVCTNGEFLQEYITLLFKNIIRFIGSDFTPMTPARAARNELRFAALQKTSGAFNATTAIECDEAAYICFASRYADETLTEADEMADASNGEFLNLHNGLFCVNMSNDMGQVVELSPQEYRRNGCLDEFVLRIPLIFPFGTVNFLIAESV